jgi:hypothetical protein
MNAAERAYLGTGGLGNGGITVSLSGVPCHGCARPAPDIVSDVLAISRERFDGIFRRHRRGLITQEDHRPPHVIPRQHDELITLLSEWIKSAERTFFRRFSE